MKYVFLEEAWPVDEFDNMIKDSGLKRVLAITRTGRAGRQCSKPA